MENEIHFGTARAKKIHFDAAKANGILLLFDKTEAKEVHSGTVWVREIHL